MEEIPFGKPKTLNKSGIPLGKQLNTDSVNQDLQDIDSGNKPFYNNGIFKDGGLTELYQQSVTNTIPNIADPYYEYIASNGKKILFSDTSGINNIYVQDYNSTTYSGIGYHENIFSQRRLIPRTYSDVCVSSDAHLLGLRYDNNAGALALYLDEISIVDLAVIQTAKIGTQYSLFVNAKIAKANILTFASVQSTSGIVYSFQNAVYFVVGNNDNLILNTVLAANYGADNLSAIWNSGTVIVAVPNNSTISTAGLYYNVNINYTSWTNLTFGAGAVQGIVLGATGKIDSARLAFTANASTYSKTIPCFAISISSAGVITTSTLFGTAFNSSGTAANFTMESGVVTPLGCAGIYSTSGAAPYGSFIMDAYKDNVPNTTKPAFIPDLSNANMASGNAMFSIATNYSYMVNASSFKSNISAINLVGTSQESIPVSLNDIGGSSFSTDIVSGNIFNSTNYNGCYIPPEYRGETTPNNINGAGVIYRLNNGSFIYVQLVSGYYNPSFISPQEISPGVVRFNMGVANTQIIDTNEYKTYADYSATGMPYLLNYTSAAASLAYIRTSNKYSTSLDYGLIAADPAITNVLSITISHNFQYNTTLWNGTTGAYLGTISNKTNGIPFLYQSANNGTYVYNGAVTMGNDAKYSGGGIVGPVSSAIQIPNYCGYLFANLLPAGNFKGFFILKGNYYAYDGQYIYSLPLTNGAGSVLSAVPQPSVTAVGLTFLDVSPDYAFFLDTYDNSIWTYSGAREINKGPVFCQKSNILSGYYNDYDNALYLPTENTILTVKNSNEITENARPFVAGAYTICNTRYGLYYIQANTAVIRTYNALLVSTIIPLIYQTGYLGYQSMRMWTLNKILVRMYCAGGLTSTLNLSWNWVTQDSNGTDTSVITTTPQSTAKYFTFEWTPPDNNVMLGSFGITDASGTQKLVLLSIDYYTTYMNEANISNKVP